MNRRRFSAILNLPAFAAAIALGAGCMSVEISSEGSLSGLDVKGAGRKASRVVSLSASGYLLFDSIPLVCGNLDWDEKGNKPAGGVRFFSNRLGVDEAARLLGKIAEKENSDLCNLVCEDVSPNEFDITSLKGIAAAFVYPVEIQASAVLVPRDAAEKKESAQADENNGGK